MDVFMKGYVHVEKVNAHDITSELLDIYNLNPLLFSKHAKRFYAKANISTALRIQEAITEHAHVLHIKNTRIKSYKVMTP